MLEVYIVHTTKYLRCRQASNLYLLGFATRYLGRYYLPFPFVSLVLLKALLLLLLTPLPFRAPPHKLLSLSCLARV